MNGKIIAAKLLKIKEGISGVENNLEIQEKLNTFGYTHERINEGRMLLDRVTGLMTAQVKEYSEQYSASDEFGKLWKKTYGNYMVTLKVIRVAFTGEMDMLQRFNAIGRRNRSLSGWLRDSKILYTNVLNSPETIEVLARYGYTLEKLNREFQDVSEVERLHSKQLSEMGTAQQSTVERDDAFDSLCKWYSKFRAIARIALFDKPQLLEALGIVKK
ncbi:MAG: hypothetical protein LBK58_06265 [Prevotellaceae bacterium]|jgi:hypothetical protein|nr:hypothetical protein [Prevotellaceae bacterium]